MSKPLTYGSLFSGIGGIDLGLDRAGMHCKWQVEIDNYATKVLAKHWPHVARYGDIRDCGVHNLESVDLICGGFPCQDISNAGKRTGIEGERSGLWKEFYRVICELRPRFVLVENVSALLHRGIERVLGDLAACGYDAEWQIISAEALGAPHLRERVFIVGYPMRLRCGRQGIQHNTGAIFSQGSQGVSSISDSTSQQQQGHSRRVLREQERCSTSPGGEDLRQTNRQTNSNFFRSNDEVVADPDHQGLAVGQVFGNHALAQLAAFKRDCSTGAVQWAVEPELGRVASRVPARVDRLRGLGNAVVPQVAEYVGRCILAAIEAEEVRS